jgi:hypothetical protein
MPATLDFIERLPEVHLQKLLRMVLNDSARVWQDEDGCRLQVLSTGEWNHADGPDFLHIALLAEGRLYVGDGEFHRRSSDWVTHKHSDNAAYKDMLLHVVLHNDVRERFADYTLVVPQADLEAAFRREQQAHQALQASNDGNNDNNSQRTAADDDSILAALELLQEYAIRRLNVKTAEAQQEFTNRSMTATDVLVKLVQRFLARQQTRTRRRPNATHAEQSITARDVERSAAAELLSHSHGMSTTALQTALHGLLNDAIAGEGAATRLEIVVNVVLPVLLARAAQEQRTAALAWFWSLPAKNRYMPLTKRFPALPQKFVWQQQGMLAYLAEIHTASTASTSQTNSSANSSGQAAQELVFVGRDEVAGVELLLYTRCVAA